MHWGLTDTDRGSCVYTERVVCQQTPNCKSNYGSLIAVLKTKY